MADILARIQQKATGDLPVQSGQMRRHACRVMARHIGIISCRSLPHQPLSRQKHGFLLYSSHASHILKAFELRIPHRPTFLKEVPHPWQRSQAQHQDSDSDSCQTVLLALPVHHDPAYLYPAVVARMQSPHLSSGPGAWSGVPRRWRRVLLPESHIRSMRSPVTLESANQPV